MRASLGIVTALVLALAAGCGGRAVPLQSTTATLIAGMYPMGEVRAAVIRALNDSRFAIVSEQGNQIQASYQRRGRMVAIAVTYSQQNVQVSYLQSAGYGARQARDGSTWISRRYSRIVTSLNQRITRELERPGREAREHQIRVANATRPVVVSPYVQPTVVAPGYTTGGYVAVQPGVHAQVTVGGPVQGAVGCEYALAQMGHSPSANIFCGGAEPYCAQELVYQGHNPSALIHCRGVDPGCAVAHLRGGGNASGLIHCR